MKKLEGDKIVSMTAEEVMMGLNESIKKYAGIDVQILHRFAFEAEIEDCVKVVIRIFDRYKEEYLDKLSFSSYSEAFCYLRSRYKKKDVEYEILEKAATGRTPKTEKKDETKSTKKKHIPEFTLKDYIELDGLREKDVETFTKAMIDDYYKYGDALKDYFEEESTDR